MIKVIITSEYAFKPVSITEHDTAAEALLEAAHEVQQNPKQSAEIVIDGKALLLQSA